MFGIIAVARRARGCLHAAQRGSHMRNPKRVSAEGIRSAAATTVSSAAAKRRISDSSITSGGRALITFMRWPATWQKMRCSWKRGTVIELREESGLGSLQRVPGRARDAAFGGAELDRPHQAEAAHVAHDRVALDQRTGQLQQQRADPLGALHQALLVEHPQRGQAGGGSEVVTAEGGAVAHGALHPVEHALEGGARDEHGADRDEAAGERLGDADDVGLQAPVLQRQEAPGAPQPGLYLVADEQRPGRAAALLGAGR